MRQQFVAAANWSLVKILRNVKKLAKFNSRRGRGRVFMFEFSYPQSIPFSDQKPTVATPGQSPTQILNMISKQA